MIALWVSLAFARDPIDWIQQLTEQDPVLTVDEAIDAERPTARWCNPGEELLPWERDWCDDVPPNCPGMVKQCELKTQGCNEDYIPETPDVPDVPGLLPSFTTMVQALVMGIAAALIVWAILQFARWRSPPELDLEPSLPNRLEKRSPAPESVVIPGDDPLREAREAAARGEIGLALMLLRAASLRALEKKGLVILHPSRTDREYVRGLRTDAEAAGALKDVISAVEKYRYAGRTLGSADLERAFLAAAKLLGLLGLVLLSSSAIARVNDSGIYPKLLKHLGYDLQIIETPDGEAPLLWDRADPAQAPALWAWIKEGHSALVLVDGTMQELPEGVIRGTTQEEPLRLPTWYDGREIHLVAPSQTLEGVGEPLLTTESGKVVAMQVRLGLGRVVLLGTPRLLEDASMFHPGNLDLLDASLRVIGAGELSVLQHAPPEEPSPFAMLFATGLGPLTGQLLLLFAVAAWWKGRRFEQRTDPPLKVRRDFTEHLRALATLYRAAGGERVVFISYASWALLFLRQRTRADEQELARSVSLRTNIPLERVSRILTRTRQLLTETVPAEGSGPADLFLQEELWEIIEAMKQGPGPSTRSQSDSGGWKRK